MINSVARNGKSEKIQGQDRAKVKQLPNLGNEEMPTHPLTNILSKDVK